MNKFDEIPSQEGGEVEAAAEEKSDVKKVPETVIEDKELVKKFAEEKMQEEKGVDKLSADINSQKKEAESEKRRKEYIQAGLDLIIANLQTQLEKKGILSFMTPKKEIQEKINNLKILKSQNHGNLAWEVIVTNATFVKNEKELMQQLDDLKNEHGLTEDDKKHFNPSEKVLNQIRTVDNQDFQG